MIRARFKPIKFKILKRPRYPFQTNLEATDGYVKAASKIILENTPPGGNPVLYGVGTSTVIIAGMMYKYIANLKYIHFKKPDESTHRLEMEQNYYPSAKDTHWIVDDVSRTGETLKFILDNIWKRRILFKTDTINGVILLNEDDTKPFLKTSKLKIKNLYLSNL